MNALNLYLVMMPNDGATIWSQLCSFQLSSKVSFISETQNILSLFCIQAEIILLGTMYLSPDVGSRAPLGLAWGLSTREQDRESLATVLGAYSGGKQAEEQSFVVVEELHPVSVTFFWDI